MVNAIYHRSYEIREPVEVRITPEELVILSFPGPDRSITMADIAAGNAVSRRYRNRRIGEFMKELELTEGRSTGIRKIKRAIAQNGSQDPVFETDDDRSYFLVRFLVHPDAMRSTNVGEVTQQVTQQVTRLLKAFDGEMSRAELMRAVGMKDRVSFSKNYLDAAITDDLIEMSQPESPNSPTQKYRLTEKGKKKVQGSKS